MIKIFIFSMLISSAAPQDNNFYKDIVGTWKSNTSGSWDISKAENITTFILNEQDENGEQIIHSFAGVVKEGNLVDGFSFSGEEEDNFFQTNDGDFCLLKKTIKATGRIEKKLKEKVIDMTNCVVKVSLNCISNKKESAVFDCSGEWN